MNRQSAPSGEIKPGLAVFWLAMILAVVAAAGCGAAQNQAAVPTVAVVKVTRDNLSTTLEIASEFQPYQEIDVFAKVSGSNGSRKEGRYGQYYIEPHHRTSTVDTSCLPTKVPSPYAKVRARALGM